MLETDGPPLKPGRYRTRKRIDRPAGLLSTRVLSEQARVYRAVVNGILTPGEGAQMIFMLKEIRCTKEAIDAAEATALANAPKPPPPPTTINVLTVPSGVFINEETMQRLNERADHFTRTPLIDHVVEPASESVVAVEPEQPKPSEPSFEPAPALPAKPTPELSPNMRRAIELGFKPLPRSRACLVE
jgi:hypothetical protein